MNKGKNPFEHDFKERQKQIITKIINGKEIKVFDKNVKINLSAPEERKAYRDAETQYVSERLLEDYGEETAQEYLNKKKGNNAAENAVLLED